MSVVDGLDASGRGKGLTRRGFLLAVGAISLLSACRGNAPPTTPKAARPATPDASFLLLSQALTGKQDLDPATADRIEKAFATLQPALHAQFPALNALVGQARDAQALLAAAGDARPAALAIITAWYTGTVGKGTQAVTVSYRDALMQRPVDDGLSPPTYAQGGPAWWTAAPPAAIRARA
ncbi:sorbitol dehydrogenase family protein [Bacillus subtilis subsp. subtilis]|nr:sorbitol dehydrogenase family protein [Bacillus subtilis subsp. subtilis]